MAAAHERPNLQAGAARRHSLNRKVDLGNLIKNPLYLLRLLRVKAISPTMAESVISNVSEGHLRLHGSALSVAYCV
jgi:hypothetical protein